MDVHIYLKYVYVCLNIYIMPLRIPYKAPFEKLKNFVGLSLYLRTPVIAMQSNRLF